MKISGKREGSEKFIVAGIVAVVIFALLVYSVNLSASAERGRKIENTLREYILIMESNGCLSAAQQQALTLRLEELGMTDIVFNGNPQQKAGYGGEVVLSVTGTVEASNITAYRDFQLVREEEGLRITKELRSTAQY